MRIMCNSNIVPGLGLLLFRVVGPISWWVGNGIPVREGADRSMVGVDYTLADGLGPCRITYHICDAFRHRRATFHTSPSVLVLSDIHKSTNRVLSMLSDMSMYQLQAPTLTSCYQSKRLAQKGSCWLSAWWADAGIAVYIASSSVRHCPV